MIPIALLIVLLYYIVSKIIKKDPIDFILKKSIEATDATVDWCDASRAVSEYEAQHDKNEHCTYRIPTTYEDLMHSGEAHNTLTEELANDPVYQKLKKRELETYIRFLETNPYCISKQKRYLIKELENTQDQELSDRILSLIFNG